jgi:3-isopropylmalate/(R)-2-methylmalate dehydratase small subunit
LIGGKCVKFGDSVNTDLIMPGRYLVSIDPAELAEHVFEPLGPDVQRQVRSSQVVVAGRNFGCGSAREQATSGLAGAGITAVVAESFARVFYRNAINTGLPAITQPEAARAARDGDEVFVDMTAGTVTVRSAASGEQSYPFTPYPPSLLRILDAGGLIPYVTAQIQSGQVKGAAADTARQEDQAAGGTAAGAAADSATGAR